MFDLQKKWQTQIDAELAGLTLKRLSPATVIAALFGAILLAAYAGNINSWALFWAGAVIAQALLRLFLISRLRVRYDHQGAGPALSARIHRVAVCSALFDGLIWAVSPFVFLQQGSVDYGFLFAILIGVAAAGAIAYTYNLLAAKVNIGLSLLPALVFILFSDAASKAFITFFGVVYICTLFAAILEFRHLLVKSLVLRLESDLAAKEATEANYMFNQHWRNTPLAAIEWDKKFQVRSWNPSAERVFGYKALEARGKKADFIVPEAGRELMREMWRGLVKRQGGKHSVHQCLRSNGELITCEWHNTPIIRDGQFLGVASFVEDITEQVGAEQTIQQQANYDSLTGLPNRRRIMEEMDKALARCDRSGQYAAVVFLDLDHFKDINDTQGHDVGDLVLKAFADNILAIVRNKDMIARFGGDEFVLLVEDLGKNEAEASVSIQRITDKILLAGNGLCTVEGITYDLDVSGGIVLFNGNWQTAHDILKKADLAMYRVKNGGRKGISFYDESLTVEAEYRVTLIRGLRHGLENQEFDVYYQPIIDRQGHIYAVEALLRWTRPHQQAVAASHFIEIMASSPIMAPVGYWLLERVCQDINTLRAGKLWHHGLSVFVNVSPRQLMDERFTTQVRKILERSGISPECLVFEITEDSLIQSFDAVKEQLHELIDMGSRLALDDFGTGYSSLAMLKNLPTHFIKLDKEFADTLLDTVNNYSIVKAITKLCEIMSLPVIAEGVETSEQQKALEKLHCDFYQGYHFYRPMPMDKLVSVLQAEKPEDEKPELYVVKAK